MVKYFTLILFIFSIFCFGQTDTSVENSFQKLIKLEKKDKISNSDIDVMIELVKDFSVQRPDEALAHLEKIKKFSEINKYQKGLVDYCFNVLKIYRLKAEVFKAEKIITDLNRKYEKNWTVESRASMQYLFADIANYNKDFDKSLKIAKRALPDAVTLFQKASLNYVIAGNYTETGNNKEALSYSLKALEFYKADKDNKNISLIYNLMGVIYQQIHNYQKAVYYGKLSLQYAEKVNSVNNILDTYSNLVVSYRGLNEIDSAKYIFNKIIDISTKLNRPYTTAQARMNMGNLYSDEKEYDKAEEQFEMSLALCQKYKINEGILYNYINLGSNYQAQNRYSDALMAYDSAVYYAKKANAAAFMTSYIYEGYTKLYESTGNYKKALENYKIKDSLNSVVNLEQSKKEIAEIQAKYDSALKDAQLEKMNHENETKKTQIKAVVAGSLFIILITVLIISFLFYRNKQLKQLYQRNVDLLNLHYFKKNEFLSREPATNNPLEKIFNDLVSIIEKEKIYQNPDLTISDVAQQINSNQKYVSNAIAEFTNMNFNNFINYYRINEAKRLILLNEYPTLNEIMYASGFNSRTPFYNAFNKFTGMSPKQFKDQATKSGETPILNPEKNLSVAE
jgi:AraC-like DNA-binding protein